MLDASPPLCPTALPPATGREAHRTSTRSDAALENRGRPTQLRWVAHKLGLVVALGALLGCGTDDRDPTTQVGGGGASANGGSTATANGGAAGLSSTGGSTATANGGAAGGPTAGGGAAGASQGGAASTVASVRLVGRMDTTDARGPRFAWSGSGAIATFSGTTLAVTLDDPGQNQFTVLIDGVPGPKLVAQAGTNTYPLGADLAPGEHRVELYRRTEASFGATQLLGFDFGPGGTLLPTPPASRRIEIIGDSITCGYGNEGTSSACSFSADTENHYAAYGAIAARAVDAELISVAWSGKGVVYNYDTDVIDPMPALYGRTLPADPTSSWDFSLIPDVVLINLGTNDFSTEGDPTPELFEQEYVKLLERVRSNYPDAFILCTVGNLLNGADLVAARAGIAAAVATFEAAGGTQIGVWEMNVPNTNPGCDFHPSLVTHQAMAAVLETELRAILGL
jgi:lysophospholipase L1-like esterase